MQMPFGLRNAAQTFQQFIDHVLRGLTFCYAYLENTLVASPDPAQHQEHLSQVFSILKNHGLRINPDKRVCGTNSLDFQGFQVDLQASAPLRARYRPFVSSHYHPHIANCDNFLGSVNFYHRFVPVCTGLCTDLSAPACPHLGCPQGQHPIDMD